LNLLVRIEDCPTVAVVTQTDGQLRLQLTTTSFVDKAASQSCSQNQVLAALLFLYQQVLGRKLEWLGNLVHAKRPVHVPVVLGRDEVRSLLAHVEGPVWVE
jgi:hypothetical protein